MKLLLTTASVFASFFVLTATYAAQTSPIQSVNVWAMIQGNEHNPNSFKNVITNIGNAGGSASLKLKPTGIILKIGTIQADGSLKAVNNCNHCWSPCMVNNGFTGSVYPWANAVSPVTSKMYNGGKANAFSKVKTCLTTAQGFKNSNQIFLDLENSNYAIPVSNNSPNPAMDYYSNLSQMLDSKKIVLAIQPKSYQYIKQSSSSYFIPTIMLYEPGNEKTLESILKSSPTVPFRIMLGTSEDASQIPGILCSLQNQSIRTNPLFKGLDIYSINDVIGSTSTKPEVKVAYQKIIQFINGDSVCSSTKAPKSTQNAQQAATPNQTAAPQNATTSQQKTTSRAAQ